MTRVLITACLLGLIQAGWSQPANTSAAGSKYPIFDSRTLTYGSDPKLFWVNNDELLFVSIRKTADASAAPQERLSYAVTRWNTQTGTIAEVRSFGENRPDICFHDGFFLYGVRRKDGSAEVYHGKLDQFEQRVDGKQHRVPFCQAGTPNLPSWTAGREIRLLEKFGAGFIDFGDRQKWTENTPVRLYRYNMKQDEGIELPFGRRDIAKRFPYYEFKRAFFVESDYPRHPRPREISYPVYWIYEDGRVEKIADIPWGPWRSSASFFPLPTRIGLVLASSNFNVRNANDLAHAGLYLFDGQRVEKIIRAWIGSLKVAVSPNGCKIAFSFAAVATDKNQVLKAMNLCKGDAR